MPQVKKESFLPRLALKVVLGCSILVLLFLFGMSMLASGSQQVFYQEDVKILWDSPLLNLLGLVLGIAACLGGMRLLLPSRLTAKQQAHRLYWLLAGILVWIAGLSLLWIQQANFYPGGGDMGMVYEAAEALYGGDYSAFTGEYFSRAPHQVSLVLVYTALFKLLHTTSFLVAFGCNLLLLLFSVFLLFRIVWLLTQSSRASAACLLLCGLFFPLVLLTPLFYGDYFALASALFGFYCALCFCRTGHWRWLWPWPPVLFVGTMARNTTLLSVMAILALFLFVGVRNLGSWKKWLVAVAVACLTLALCLCSTSITRRYTEFRFGCTLADGQPMLSYLVIGMKESSRGCGYYDGFGEWVLEASGGDYELGTLKSRIELGHMIDRFASDPAYARWFYANKLCSEWSDPAFQSLISVYYRMESFDPSDYTRTAAELLHGNAFYQSVFSGKTSQVLRSFLNQCQNLVYLAAIIGVLCIWRKKDSRLWHSLPLIYLLAGFLFYFAWEAKGRYCLPFYFFLLPVAGLGLAQLDSWVSSWQRHAKPPATPTTEVSV